MTGQDAEREGDSPVGIDPATTLVVEDDKGVRVFLQKFLKMKGRRVRAAGDAETAWQLFEEEPAALVLVDWQLPGMSGLDLCDRIRDLPGGDRITIVMVTGQDQPGDWKHALARGADDYITKPFSTRDLALRLSVIERRLAGLHGDAVNQTE